MFLFYLHAGCMGAGFVLMAAGAGMAVLYRQRRWWLKAHRALGMTGSLVMLPGLAAALVMVGQDGEGHLRVPHAWAGLSMCIFAFITPLLGHLQFLLRKQAKPLREAHRWTGRAALIAGLLTILSGLRAAGII